MRIEVTEEDIALGRKQDANWCPVARAVKRATGFTRVTVGHHTVCMWLEPDSVEPDKRIELPVSVRQTIIFYDLGGGMYPFRFEL